MAFQQQKKAYTVAEMAVLEESILKQQAEIAELNRKLEHMSEVFANAQRAHFGQSSEKNTYVLHGTSRPVQQSGAGAEPQSSGADRRNLYRQCSPAQPGGIDPGSSSERSAAGIGGNQLGCGKCGRKMKPIGKKFVRHELEIIPKQVILKAIYTVTYTCVKCEKDTGFAHVVSVKPPDPLMKHSLASASTVADVMTKKYVDDLPLARQEKI